MDVETSGGAKKAASPRVGNAGEEEKKGDLQSMRVYVTPLLVLKKTLVYHLFPYSFVGRKILKKKNFREDFPMPKRKKEKRPRGVKGCPFQGRKPLFIREEEEKKTKMYKRVSLYIFWVGIRPGN